MIWYAALLYIFYLQYTHTKLHNLSKMQKVLEYNKYGIMNHNIQFRYLHVKITMTFPSKQDLAFHQMSSYIQRIAMMHRRERKTNIRTAHKKLHASSINHTTKTKSKCRRPIPPSHAARFFFSGRRSMRFVKRDEKKKHRSLSWGNAMPEVAGAWRTRFRCPIKCSLEPTAVPINPPRCTWY